MRPARQFRNLDGYIESGEVTDETLALGKYITEEQFEYAQGGPESERFAHMKRMAEDNAIEARRRLQLAQEKRERMRPLREAAAAEEQRRRELAAAPDPRSDSEGDHAKPQQS